MSHTVMLEDLCVSHLWVPLVQMCVLSLQTPLFERRSRLQKVLQKCHQWSSLYGASVISNMK